MDYEALARELVRVLRGSRSQPWLSRRLGLRSNLVYRWESGRAFPSAQQFFRICKVMHARGSLELASFLGGSSAPSLDSAAGVTTLLTRLARGQTIAALAESVGQSRFVVSRWLAGKTQVRLPDLLRFVDLTTRRLLDFCSIYVDPTQLASMAKAWKRLQAARRAAFELPWSHAVLRALELVDYAKTTEPTESWLTERLGIPCEDVARSLELLRESGQIKRRAGRFRVVESGLIDTGVDREKRQALRAFWTRVAVQQLERGAPGIHAFNLFTIAQHDVPLIQAWHTEFFERIRGLVAKSSPADQVMLYSAQILTLDQRRT